MKFENWVKSQGGPMTLASKLGLHSMTVQQWLWGKSTPKALMMQKLVKMGRGNFDFQDIINETKKKGDVK